jgi:hypothetical protein
MYHNGKKSGHSTGTTNPSYGAGKGANSVGAKVSYSAGKSSGTARNGDPKGCSPMSTAKKSMDSNRSDD